MDMTEVILEQVRFWRDAGMAPRDILSAMGRRTNQNTIVRWGDVITRMEQFYVEDIGRQQAEQIAAEGYENAHTEQYQTIITLDG